jgi:uncharacterized protein (DUF433 family)
VGRTIEVRDIYGGNDPTRVPAYGIPEAAHYLGIPETTLSAWAFGQRMGNTRAFVPVIHVEDQTRRALSFVNLVEAHVLDALRNRHRVSLQKVRLALGYLSTNLPSDHPLADNQFATDGLDLFVEKYGELINVSRDGQLAMKEVLAAYLSRIERNAVGHAIKLFPFTRNTRLGLEQPKTVVINPKVSFGRPILAGTSIPTAVIADRYKAGDAIAVLAEDYHRSALEIEEAIRCELPAA